MFVDMEDLNTKKRRAWLRKEQEHMKTEREIEKRESLLSPEEKQKQILRHEEIEKRFLKHELNRRPKNRMMYSDSEGARAEKVQKTIDMFVVGMGMFFIGVLVGAIAMLMWVS